MDWMEILERFAHPEPREKYSAMAKPWTLADGRVVGCDGRVAIVLNKGVIEVEPNDGGKPDIEEVLRVKKGYGDKVKWPKLPPLESDPCKLCRGKGTGHKCRSCDGSGDHDCDCNQCECAECTDCDGTGFKVVRSGVGDFKCPECEGKGAKVKKATIDFNGARFDLEMMHRFDGIEGLTGSIPAANNAMFVHFDEGIGVIVPLLGGNTP